MKAVVLLFLSLCLFDLHSSGIVPKKTLDEMCEKANITIELENWNQTIPEYIEYLGISEDEHGILADYLLHGQTSIPWTDLSKKNMLSLLILVAFVPIVAITWVLFWLCCCCNCSVFKKKDAGGMYKCTVFFLNICIFSGVIIGAIVAFATSSKFIKHLVT